MLISPAEPKSFLTLSRRSTFDMRIAGRTATFTFSDIQRFMALVDFPENLKDCWLWTGSHDRAGYGTFYVKQPERAILGTHRVAYEMWKGPIPDGLATDHLCCTPGCSNPLHLEIVTYSENTRRWHATRPKTHCIQGHEFTADNTYLNPQRNGDMRRQCKACIFAATNRRRERLKRERDVD